MKYIILISLLAIVTGFVYWRLRPYINTVRHVLKVLRGVRVQHVGEAGTPADLRRQSGREAAPATSAGGKLVRCQSCGIWLPAARAVTLRSSTASYCSHDCLERTADHARHTRKSAS